MRQYLTPQMLSMLLLGFSCGIPLTLTASTLAIYLNDIGLSLQSIGLFAMTATPYSLKPLWAPLIDSIRLPYLSKLGHRKSWLILMQILLILMISIVATVDIKINLLPIVFLLIAFFSASQDIIVDALRIETLKEVEQGIGSANYSLGYRVGMLCAGVGTLYLSELYTWKIAFIFIALSLSIGVLATLMITENRDIIKKSTNFKNHVINAYIQPFIEFSNRRNWLMILLLISIYKLSDAYIGKLTGPFLIEIGFSKIEIANIVKLYGVIATLLGGYLGGYLAKKYTDSAILAFAAILSALGNLLFILQYYAGYNIGVLIGVISVENFVSSIGNIIFIVYISKLCNKEFTITQYALLSSLAAMGRTFVSSTSGIVQTNFGWVNFFIFSALLTLPALILIKLLNNKE